MFKNVYLRFTDTHDFLFLFCLQGALNSLRIAIIGQSQFGAEVYNLLRHQGHTIVGVFTIPDKGKPDPLGLLLNIINQYIGKLVAN